MKLATITIKSEREIASMCKAGRVVARAMEVLAKHVHPGVRTAELDAIAYREITGLGAIPSFKGYRGYPATICTSINEEIVHGIPGPRALKQGDIIGIDVGAIVEGYHGDAAFTAPVGKVSDETARLIEAARGALAAAIRTARHGAFMGDLSYAIQQYAESRGFSVVREYVGHGIGRELHEDPAVPNFGQPGQGMLLQKGMTLAIEPMVNAGTWRTRVKNDLWTVVTEDKKWSAHFEHTIVITEHGAEVLTHLDVTEGSKG